MVKQNLDPTLARPIKQYQLVGRAAPTQKTPVPKIYRMKIFAASKVLLGFLSLALVWQTSLLVTFFLR